MRTETTELLTLVVSLISVGLLSRERSDVLLYEWTELRLIDITNEVEVEATSISEAATIELEDALIVDLLDFLLRQWIGFRIIWVHEADDGVSEEGERIGLRSL